MKEIVRSLSNEFDLARVVIDELDLLHHHKSLYVRVPNNRYMKRVTPVSGGQGSDHGETGLFIEQGTRFAEKRLLFIVRPHTDDFNRLYIIKDLVDESMLDTDLPGTSAG